MKLPTKNESIKNDQIHIRISHDKKNNLLDVCEKLDVSITTIIMHRIDEILKLYSISK